MTPELRKKEKQIHSRREVESVLRRSRYCRMAMSDGGQPYAVTLCFGYEGNAVYFHSALEGRKIDILRKNPKVCLLFDVDKAFVESQRACKWSVNYKSVTAFGRAAFVEDAAGKKRALALIMRQYSDRTYRFEDSVVAKTSVIRVDIAYMTGKRSKT